MSNKLPCPSCGKSHEMSELLRTLNAEDAFMVALTVPDAIAGLVMNYTELFAPVKQSLSLNRRGKLIHTLELADKDPRALAYAIEQVLERDSMGKLTKPLSNHNYLLKVMESYVADDSNTEQTQYLSEKQVLYFAKQLIEDGQYQQNARAGESYAEFLIRTEQQLRDPESMQALMPHLERLGFGKDNRK